MRIFSSSVGSTDGKRASVARLAFSGDCAAVGFRNALDNGKAEAAAAGADAGRIGAKKAVKDKGQILRRDPDAGIGDASRQCVRASSETETVTVPPGGVYTTAFSTRFWTRRRKASASPRTTASRSCLC